MNVKLAVIYYSSTGNVHALAEELANGAADVGASVRLRKVGELAPPAVVRATPRWQAHLDATGGIPEVTHADLLWADGYAFGSPTRYGNVAAQLRQFLDTTGGLWEAGKLADRTVTGFTSSATLHGGQESTLLSMYTVFMHWGSVIVPPGYTDPSADISLGNPYGASSLDRDDGPSAVELDAARHQGRRLALKTAALIRGAVPRAA